MKIILRQILRDVFGPMPTVRTVIARVVLSETIFVVWVVLASLSLGLDVIRAALRHHR